MGFKLQSISRFDAFARTEDHLMHKTNTGAVVTLIGIVLIAILFVHEMSFYLTPTTQHEMSVDLTREEKLSIFVNMSLPSLPCQGNDFCMSLQCVLSMDALDMSGQHDVDIGGDIFKLLNQARLDSFGQLIPGGLVVHDDDHDHGGSSMFGQTQQEYLKEVSVIQTALAAGEGCRVFGHLDVSRVAGNFHISVHGHSMPVLEQVFGVAGKINVSHSIHSMSFGPPYPSMHNPLDGFDRILDELHAGTFKYFLKIVPTTYKHLHQGIVATNQYSVTEYFSPTTTTDQSIPAIYFVYDFSPITVTIAETRKSLAHFLTRLCAVVGGSFAVTGMLDKWIYRVVTALSGPSK
eukprot:jgi/Chlat1/1074/Chrsp110S01542